MDEEQMDESMISAPGNYAYEYMQRMFPFRYRDNAPTVSYLPMAAMNDPFTDSEMALALHANKYEGILCGKLFRADKSRGSCFPVSPVSEHNTACWLTCQHVARDGNGLFLSTSLDPRSYMNAKYFRLDFVPPPTSPAAMLCPPSSPQHPLVVVHTESADVAVFEVHSTDDCPNHHRRFFIPSAREVQSGDKVACIGYPAKPSAHNACNALTTQHDYEVYKSHALAKGMEPKPAEYFRLEVQAALARAQTLDEDPREGGAFFSNHLCASPGTVLAVNETVVEHGCSTLSGMSGAPCVLLDSPFELVAIHIQGSGSFVANRNYAVSVHHPRFVELYVRTAVAMLSNMAPDVFNFDSRALRTLLEYLQRHREVIDQRGLTPVVMAFKYKMGIT